MVNNGPEAVAIEQATWFRLREYTDWHRVVLLGTLLSSLSYVVFDVVLHIERVRQWGFVVWFLSVGQAYPAVLVMIGVANHAIGLLIAYAFDSLIERAAPGGPLYDMAHVRPARPMTRLALFLLGLMLLVGLFWWGIAGLSFWLFLSGWMTVLLFMLIEDPVAFMRSLRIALDRTASALQRLPLVGNLIPPPRPPDPSEPSPSVANPLMPFDPQASSAGQVTQPLAQPVVGAADPAQTAQVQPAVGAADPAQTAQGQPAVGAADPAQTAPDPLYAGTENQQPAAAGPADPAQPGGPAAPSTTPPRQI